MKGLLALLTVLGWAISIPKLVDFSSRVKFNGVLWDFDAKTAEIPDDKRQKFLARAEHWVELAGSDGVSLQMTEELAGSLEFCAFVYREGRPYVQTLYAFMHSFHQSATRFVTIRASREAISDVRVWIHLLKLPSMTRSLSPLIPLDIDIYVDASTSWGIALVVEGAWRAWCYHPGALLDGRDIGWAESIGIEFAIRHIAALGHQGRHVVVRSDNQGSIGQYLHDRGRNIHTNASIKRSIPLVLQSDFDIDLIFVPSALNLADPFSRGEQDAMVRHPELPRLFAIPGDLSTFLFDYEQQ